MSTHLDPDVTADQDATRRGLAVLLLAALLALPHTTAAVAARAVVNLPLTAGAVVWARAHGGRCTVHADLTVECPGMSGGYAHAATTVGNTWLYGDLDGADRHRHEARHSDQWAMFDGSLLFPALYALECLRVSDHLEDNVFERWAGLHDGGYSTR